MRITIVPLALVAFAFTAAASSFAAQSATPHPLPQVHGHPHEMAGPSSGQMPQEPGQEMFGTIAEVIRILEADPKTDWSRVNIPALRKHLIDMNEVALHADAKAQNVAGGVRIEVTGTGRTLAAIRRMVTMHARTMDGHFGWHFTASEIPDGTLLTVVAQDPAQATKIRALGFMGLMVYGTHHGRHHLAIARGDMPY